MIPTFEEAMSAAKRDAGDRTAEELTDEALRHEGEQEKYGDTGEPPAEELPF